MRQPAAITGCSASRDFILDIMCFVFSLEEIVATFFGEKVMNVNAKLL